MTDPDTDIERDRRERLENFQNLCKNIIEYKGRELVERPKWGDINFRKIETEIETIFWLVEEIDTLPLDILPDNAIEGTIQHLNSIKEAFKQLDIFPLSKTGSNPNDLRDDIVQKFKDGLQRMLNTIGPWLPLLALRVGNIGSLITGMKDSNEEATKASQEMKKIKEESKEIKEESEKIIKEIRGLADDATTAKFAKSFENEAKSAEDKNKKWLWATALLAAGTLLLIFGLFGHEVSANPWEAAYQIGGRVIAISILFSATAWSGRIVLANMHLASVNRHRAASLETLDTFRKAVGSEDARDAVVRAAARAAYENVPSGFIKSQANEPAGGRTELIKNTNKAFRSGDQGSS